MKSTKSLYEEDAWIAVGYEGNQDYVQIGGYANSLHWPGKSYKEHNGNYLISSNH